MMNQTYGSMSAWMGGAMWTWPLIGIFVVIIVALMANSLARKYRKQRK